MGNALKQLLCSGSTNYMDDEIDYERKQLNLSGTEHKCSSRTVIYEDIMQVALPELFQLYILQHESATLINSSTLAFGRECIRLVNIAFHASQIFPSMMGTCDAISQYIRQELIRRHPRKYFHIIIGENQGFDFAISDFEYFVDIKYEHYFVLIFSTSSDEKVKFDTHNANTQMKLHWKSVLIK
ncbi:unnamed protein product [Rotaria magnacalcarata]|uniref:Uncharacterized protein n=1 Tax=Rotaria magnacalcarata TaxID=392030 RepID=A0A814FKQ2_9BILA|nr:unnamed protein product [Rotaria magnacalcarata]CAF1915992.1 unnamed protein product [Rotaria magnacalcarata]CAF3854864.1 unnamed protein product [Rotaria magnacalcarata]CAF3873926.1 unnamed protein product [Rotaria magnacalcarata]